MGQFEARTRTHAHPFERDANRNTSGWCPLMGRGRSRHPFILADSRRLIGLRKRMDTPNVFEFAAVPHRYVAGFADDCHVRIMTGYTRYTVSGCAIPFPTSTSFKERLNLLEERGV